MCVPLLLFQEWQESDAKLVKGGKQVMPLRQFSTNIHTVSAQLPAMSSPE